MLTSVTGLVGCPLLLDDEFVDATSLQDAGDGVCVRLPCSPRGAGGSGGAAANTQPQSGGSGGRRTPGAGGSIARGGTGGATGSASSGGMGGSSVAALAGSGGAAASGGAPGTDNPCWRIPLSGATTPQASPGNCLEIWGWNAVVNDETAGAVSTVTASYRNGNVCFAGTIDKDGWGAIFNLTFANDAIWDAAAHGVSGFKFGMTARIPPNLQVTYQDIGAGDDFCRDVVPASSVVIPFNVTHPDCSTSSTAPTPDLTQLTHLRIGFLPTSANYDLDVCIEALTAIP
jgi:hypothetical protein